MARNNKTYFYHRDSLGSITTITDESSNVVQEYEYDSFGNITYIKDSSFVQPYTFTGREYDSETGLLYLRERYLDPLTGTFVSADPIAFAGEDVNLYRYVENSPINYMDPFGLFKFKDINWKTIQIGTGTALINPFIGSIGIYGGLLGLTYKESVEGAVEGVKHAWNRGYYECLGKCMILEKGHFYMPPLIGEGVIQIIDRLLEHGAVDWISKEAWKVKVFNKVPPLGIYEVSKKTFISRVSGTLKMAGRALAVVGLASFIHETYSCTKKCIKCTL